MDRAFSPRRFRGPKPGPSGLGWYAAGPSTFAKASTFAKGFGGHGRRTGWPFGPAGREANSAVRLTALRRNGAMRGGRCRRIWHDRASMSRKRGAILPDLSAVCRKLRQGFRGGSRWEGREGSEDKFFENKTVRIQGAAAERLETGFWGCTLCTLCGRWGLRVEG